MRRATCAGLARAKAAHGEKTANQRGKAKEQICHRRLSAPRVELLSSARAGTVALPAQAPQRLAAAGSIDRDRRQQLAQLRCRAADRSGSRRPWSAARSRGRPLCAALSSPSWNRNTGTPSKRELAGAGAQPVDLLLHAVADVDERVDLALLGLHRARG